ncbi:MAG: hypothetical protein JWN86_1392 [Planctomycetota bacterium]|nr:hypothetical protein [Planctomycetota bacterium]
MNIVPNRDFALAEAATGEADVQGDTPNYEDVDFPALVRAILPERATEFDALLRQLGGVTFQVDDTAERIKFQADPIGVRVIVGIACLGRLFVHAHTDYTAFDFLLKLHHQGRTSADLAPEEREALREIDELLTWAVTMDVNTAVKMIRRSDQAPPPPESLVRLLDIDPESVSEHATRAVFENALTFIILHEITHLKNSDGACVGDRSIQQEKDADRGAAAWMLEDIEFDNTFMLRAFGIAVALTWLTTLDVYLGPNEGNTHPPAYDRLSQVIGQYACDDDDPACETTWAFIYSILIIHLRNRQILLSPDHLMGPFRERAECCINLIANQ